MKTLTKAQIQKLKHDLARLTVVLNVTRDAVAVSDDDPVIWAMGLHSLQGEMESLRLHAEEALEAPSVRLVQP